MRRKKVGRPTQKSLEKATPTKALGRPSSYNPTYCDDLISFFIRPYYTVGAFGKLIPTEPPFMSAWARKIGVSENCIWQWQQKFPDFDEAIKKAKKIQEEHYVSCGFAGASNPAVTIFLLKNHHGYTDRQELTPEQLSAFIQQVLLAIKLLYPSLEQRKKFFVDLKNNVSPSQPDQIAPLPAATEM